MAQAHEPSGSPQASPAFTPGPWKLLGKFRVINTKWDWVATTLPAINIITPRVTANARLIAAAPQMLACTYHLLELYTDRIRVLDEQLADMADSGFEGDDVDEAAEEIGRNRKYYEDLKSAAEAAIAKATGRRRLSKKTSPSTLP